MDKEDYIVVGIDFVSLFPEELSLLIFSFLPLHNVGLAMSMSSDWQRLLNDNIMWKNILLCGLQVDKGICLFDTKLLCRLAKELSLEFQDDNFSGSSNVSKIYGGRLVAKYVASPRTDSAGYLLKTMFLLMAASPRIDVADTLVYILASCAQYGKAVKRGVAVGQPVPADVRMVHDFASTVICECISADDDHMPDVANRALQTYLPSGGVDALDVIITVSLFCAGSGKKKAQQLVWNLFDYAANIDCFIRVFPKIIVACLKSEDKNAKIFVKEMICNLLHSELAARNNCVVYIIAAIFNECDLPLRREFSEELIGFVLRTPLTDNKERARNNMDIYVTTGEIV